MQQHYLNWSGWPLVDVQTNGVDNGRLGPSGQPPQLSPPSTSCHLRRVFDVSIYLTTRYIYVPNIHRSNLAPSTTTTTAAGHGRRLGARITFGCPLCARVRKCKWMDGRQATGQGIHRGRRRLGSKFVRTFVV